MLSLLLCVLLQAGATPPPLPTAEAPRIEGLMTTFVTPDAFVGGLHPRDAEAPAAAVQLALRDDASVDAEAVAAALDAVEGVRAEVAGGQVRIAPGTSGVDVTQLPVPTPDGPKRLVDLGVLMPLPVAQLRLPNGALPIPAQAGSTGHDLVITNPIGVAKAQVEVQGTRIGIAGPSATVVLHDVRPGAYDVVFHLATGHQEAVVVDSQARGDAEEAPDEATEEASEDSP